ncbi:hypothetical protein ACH427_13520 [Streptomyces sp. NPDC020379]|uniref:hypothetical protein n=1 Tax=Streptomyces sp. NPDC020379 TaxID=3365071 RepID=UPI003791BB75
MLDLSSSAVLAWCIKEDIRPEFVFAALELALENPFGRRLGAGVPLRAEIRCTHRLQRTDAVRAVATAGDVALERTMHAHSSDYREFLRRHQDVYSPEAVAGKTWAWVSRHNDEVAKRLLEAERSPDG